MEWIGVSFRCPQDKQHGSCRDAINTTLNVSNLIYLSLIAILWPLESHHNFTDTLHYSTIVYMISNYSYMHMKAIFIKPVISCLNWSYSQFECTECVDVPYLMRSRVPGVSSRVPGFSSCASQACSPSRGLKAPVPH